MKKNYEKIMKNSFYKNYEKNHKVYYLYNFKLFYIEKLGAGRF